MVDYAPNIILSQQEYKVVGTRPTRHDAQDKVTGRAHYSADVHPAGLLSGRVLRSPHAHARILSINTDKAKALPGVRAVATSADFPQFSGQMADLGEGAMVNFKFLSNNCLAHDRVLYVGQAIAAVAASTPEIAEEAMNLIEVEYEVLKPVLDARDAMKQGAPILHDQLATLTNPTIRAGAFRGDDDAEDGTNVASHIDFRLGDVEEGFRQADTIVEHETHTAAVHQGYIEPHSATAQWHPDGHITVWSSSQGHFMVRDQTATILGLPVSRVTAIPMEIGGGFGGKTIVYLEPVAAILSRESGGAPVKLTMNRTEVFEGTGPTSGSHIKVKLGATKDGHITAVESSLIYEAGAFPGSPMAAGIRCMLAPYDIPNGYLEGYDVVVNKPKSAAYRAPGSPAAAFAMETTVDLLCEKLNMDPLEFRLLNASKEGTRQVTGPVFGRVGNVENLQAALDHDHYKTPLEGPNRGRGVASGFWFNASGPSAAVAVVNPDGSVQLIEGSVDVGGTRTAVSMQLAEVLGISAEDVHPQVADTDTIGYTSVAGGSSTTFKTGWSCYEAAQDVKRQMIARAARIWEVDAENVEYNDGVLQHTSDPALRMTFKELAPRLIGTGGPIIGRGNVNPPGPGNAFCTVIVDVEVDPDTGKVYILRCTAIQDAGKAIHPTYVEGQIQGGVVQGIGWALNEEYFFNDQGRMMNASFLDYRMPTSLDLPMVDTVIVEVANPNHPFGVRGVGEVSICPPMPAISNAIAKAIGARLNELPMSPGRVQAAVATNGSA